MIYIITILILISASFESMSYFRQIRKTIRRKHSRDISLKSYRDKLIKYMVAILALVLAHNWAGLVLEVWAFLMCACTYITIRRFK